MASEYKLEIQRPGVNAILYQNDDGTLEITDPDSGEKIEYAGGKINIAKEMITWMKKYSVTSVECTKV